MTKSQLTKKLKALDKISDAAWVLERRIEELRNKVAIDIAPCKIGDMIEGGKEVRRKGRVARIYSKNSAFPCIVVFRPIGSKGKLLKGFDKFYYPETIKVLTPA